VKRLATITRSQEAESLGPALEQLLRIGKPKEAGANRYYIERIETSYFGIEAESERDALYKALAADESEWDQGNCYLLDTTWLNDPDHWCIPLAGGGHMESARNLTLQDGICPGGLVDVDIGRLIRAYALPVKVRVTESHETRVESRPGIWRLERVRKCGIHIEADDEEEAEDMAWSADECEWQEGEVHLLAPLKSDRVSDYEEWLKSGRRHVIVSKPR